MEAYLVYTSPSMSVGGVLPFGQGRMWCIAYQRALASGALAKSAGGENGTPSSAQNATADQLPLSKTQGIFN